MNHHPRGLQSALGLKMQRMKSLEADFEKATWTFSAPSFTVSGGDYLVISKLDWMLFWDLIASEAEALPSTSTASQP